MVIYGTKIEGEIDLPYDFPEDAEYLHKITLSPKIPKQFSEALCHKTYLHLSHGKKVYLGKDVSSDTLPSKRFWSFEVEGVGRFGWEQGDTTVYYDKVCESKLFGFWLAHSLMPIYLTLQRKAIILHASCVTIEDSAVLFIAPSFGGKSTLAHAFLQQKYPLVSDDTVALYTTKDAIKCAASVPYSRPYRTLSTLGDYTPVYEKRLVTPKAVYVLEKGAADEAVTFDELRGIAKLTALHNNNLLYSFPHLRTMHLATMGELIKQTAIVKLKRPWDLAQLPALCTQIVSFTKALT
ncbi:hypothetical protein MNB_SV-4-1113 [hydrothermal vent metagenome]|uniref:Serine kinase of the HPr protein, regulates carbohydrate metabolism n=1 Tax=hydrothermal vent metagenome TaxID=652676 RepID=A0A1W1E8H8_9ZZZZ